MKKLYNNKVFGKDSIVGIDLSEVVAFWLKRDTQKGYGGMDIGTGYSLVLLIRQAMNSRPCETQFTYSTDVIYKHINWNDPTKNVIYTPETFYVGKEIYDDLVKYWSTDKVVDTSKF